MPRKSIAKQMDMQTEFNNTLLALREIWDEIGIPDDQIESRGNTVMLHIHNLFDDMVKEEKDLKNNMLEKIAKHKDDISELSAKLFLSVKVEDLSKVSIMQREKALRSHVSYLEKIKSERICQLAADKSVEQALCDQLCTTPCYIPTGTIPSEDQLKQLQEHVETLKKEKARRKNVLSDRKEKIVQIYDVLEMVPETSFAQDLVSDELDSFCLTSDKMEELEDLHGNLAAEKRKRENLAFNLWKKITDIWDRLETGQDVRKKLKKSCPGIKPIHIAELKEALAQLEEKKKANLQHFTEQVRSKIFGLWDKCFYTNEQRQMFVEASEENYTEVLLDAHEAELAKMEAYYDENQKLFNNIARWQDLFNTMLKLEEKPNNLDRYSNRGGKLLQEEKERRKIQKQLPKIEEDLFVDIERWEEENQVPFLVEGIRFNDYVHAQWEDFERRKENEKRSRQLKKKEETRAEMTFGSTPKTPTKRRFIGTNTILKTPTSNKKKRMDSTWRSTATVTTQNRTAASAYAMTSSPGKPPICTRLRTPMSAKRTRPAAKRALDDPKQVPKPPSCSGSVKSAPCLDTTFSLSTTVVSSSTTEKTESVKSVPLPDITHSKYCDFASDINSNGTSEKSSKSGTDSQTKCNFRKRRLNTAAKSTSTPNSTPGSHLSGFLNEQDSWSTTIVSIPPKISCLDVAPSKYAMFDEEITKKGRNKHVRSSAITNLF